jgi:hypothetical protein
MRAMRRAAQFLVAVLSTASLLLFVSACTLWVRGYLGAESFFYTKRAEVPGRTWERILRLSSDRGLMEFTLISGERKWDPARDRRLTRPDPGFTHWSARGARIIDLTTNQSPGEPLWARLGFRFGGQVVQDATQHRIYRSYAWPDWLAVVLTIPLPVARLLAWRRRRKSRHWQMAGRCAACGYDLRFRAGRCSECGTMMPVGFGPGTSTKRVLKRCALATAVVAVLLGGWWSLRRHADPLAPIARFSFDRDDSDASSGGAQVERINVPIEVGSLVINGLYEHGAAREAAYRAVVDVPQLDYDAFTVVWRFRCAAIMASGKWNLLTGGTSYRWMSVSRGTFGRMKIDFNNGDTAAQEIGDTEIEPGRWFQAAVSVDVKRRRGFVMLDGRKVADLQLPPDFALRVVGSEADRTDRALTFTNYSNGNTFAGQVDEIIVFRRALSERELVPYWHVEPTAPTAPISSPSTQP